MYRLCGGGGWFGNSRFSNWIGPPLTHVAHSPGEDFTNDVITSCKAGSTCEKPTRIQKPSDRKHVQRYVSIYIIIIVYNVYIYIVYRISLQCNTYQKISEYIWYQSLHSHTLLVSLEIKHGERSDPFELAIILRQGLSSNRYGHECRLGMKRTTPAHVV